MEAACFFNQARRAVQNKAREQREDRGDHQANAEDGGRDAVNQTC